MASKYDNVMAEIERRYPNEDTKALADEFDMPLASLRTFATRRGWRKTREYLVRMGNNFYLEEGKDAKIMHEMAGWSRRSIQSGLLLVKAGRVVHLAK